MADSFFPPVGGPRPAGPYDIGPPPLPGYPGAPIRPPRPPSATPLVLSVIASVVAILFLLFGLLFWKVARDQTAAQPTYQAQIDALWDEDGIPIPGDGTVQLERSTLYYAYLEAPVGKATSDSVDITVTNADTGEPVSAAGHLYRSAFQHKGRELLPRATFRVPASGRYKVTASARHPEPPGDRVKVGPDAKLADGSLAGISRNLAFGSFAIAALLSALAVVGIHRYRRRRRNHDDAVHAFYTSQTATWPPASALPPP